MTKVNNLNKTSDNTIMKTLFSIFILFRLKGVSLGIPALGHGALAGYCDTSSQCGVGECCRRFNQPRGKGMVLDHIDYNLIKYAHGSCQKMGTHGERCFVDELKTDTVGLLYDCPCATGFECKGTGTSVFDKGELGVCVSVNIVKSTLNQPCSSGEDCADSECCLYNMPIFGKRSVHSHCSSMGTSGSGCLVNLGSGKPNDIMYACPCLSGRKCNGTGLSDAFGEMGICVN